MRVASRSKIPIVERNRSPVRKPRKIPERAKCIQQLWIFPYQAPTNAVGSDGFQGGSADAGPTAGFDPVLISLIRRSMPNLVAYDLAGVQPMSGPTGLIFAMRSRYTDQSGTEAFYNEADTAFSGQPKGLDDANGFSDAIAGMGTTAQAGSNPAL